MLCRKCNKEIPEDSKFCNHCGAKQVRDRSSRKKGNGQGTAFKDKNGKWIAEYTIGWDVKDGVLTRKRRKKRGFATKHEALAYIPCLKQDLPPQDMDIKFKDLYQKWLDRHEEKVSRSTINCYKSAYKYFAPLYYVEVSKIRTEHLQKCIDECPHGTRTRENMKALGTSLWRYAMERDIVDRNYAEYIYIRKGNQCEKIAFSKEHIDAMWENVDAHQGIKYILVLCYTGMRLSEMTGAKTQDYHPEEGYFVTGVKTEAGKNRAITISPKILPFFKEFAQGEFLFFGKKMSQSRFRNDIFYPALQSIGIDQLDDDGEHIYTPHCCRHTFATLMKDVTAPATDKQRLIGHSKFEMTAHYTHTDIASLKRITDNL